jgi:hypothetical protein
VLKLAAHDVRPADRPPDHRLVEDRPQLDRWIVIEPALSLHPQVDQALDLLLGVPGEHLAEHGAGIVLGLQQPVHHGGLIAADRRRLGLKPDVNVETAGQHVVVGPHQPLRCPSRAISTSTWRCWGSATPYSSSIWCR